MPEVPENMQDNIAYLEQHSYDANQDPSLQASGYSSSRHDQGQPVQGSDYASHSAYRNGYGQHPQAQNMPPPNRSNGGDYGQYNQQPPPMRSDYPEQPSFSPFPVLRDPPPNVPPTDDQREARLEEARIPVLGSNDPENQLAWAADALAYVEIGQQNETRVSAYSNSRPQTPIVEHQLKTDAINVVSFLADQHHPRAEFIKGMWLEFGKFGFRIDKKEAFMCYKRASEKGYARAEYRIGMQFESSNDSAAAIRHYRAGVDAGDSASNYRLGMMILLGQHGQEQDFERGLHHVEFAADTADDNAPQGAYVYGMLQARELPQVNIPERFLPLDLNVARISIEKAAFLGFAKAQVKMGTAYELCQLGCDFNPALSLHYNALAARQGEAEAEMAISKWFLCGQEGVFEKNEEMAFLYAQRAAQNGLPTAEFAMGYFYEIGIYTQPDIKEARVWYAKAAANGNKDAAGRIDGISRSKTLSRKDHENIAIKKIQSRYGSHAQSSEFEQPPLPALPRHNTLEMPDPSRLSISDGSYPPQRPTSTAPYPLEDPMHTGRPRPGASPGYPNPEQRPTSAFQINPNIRPVSAASQGPVRADQYRVPSGPGPQRPYSRSADLGAGYGRGVPPSNQGYRQPGPGLPQNAGRGAGGPPTSKADFGFSAPLDLSGPDKPARMPRTNTPGANSINDSRPQPPPINPNVAPQRLGPKTAGTSSGPGGSNLGRIASPHPASAYPSTPSPRPEYANARPPTVNSSRPPPTSAAGKPPGRPSGNTPAPTPAPLANRPGKGPKTFEEMGIPKKIKEDDCVGHSSLLFGYHANVRV